VKRFCNKDAATWIWIDEKWETLWIPGTMFFGNEYIETTWDHERVQVREYSKLYILYYGVEPGEPEMVHNAKIGMYWKGGTP
jgi:hypothetical protein